ncbi:type IV secretion protein Rhs [Vibrio sp. OCN044]|uniref:Type IV secretion protein Rhs n=1 Tax=Vibrio tetraodonis subsp. pristinus TaxID=2695891 RepID=A0A6L8LP17_9VIBR|nr:RHS repeat-associated core domain-containing protein [Vibrio tetraodonis]MYM57744.1 type IV secretion protein Rhs [Vibrio tetraodonis subsp. pristinus]
MKSIRLTRALRLSLTGLCLGGMASSAFALTSGAGKSIELSGEFAASGGEATYSLPLSVSPGRAGHQPSLSLEYRSDSPNGMLGMGWSIGGVSAISRCGQNLNNDGRWGGVRFNGDDRYCLDGKRLIAVSGRDGEDLTEYRLENNGYSKIISFGRAGNGPASFKIWYKDGSVYEYGVTQDARVELPGQAHAYKWALNKTTDSSKQNHINFVYSEDNAAGKHKLAEINYVGGKVKFVYQARPDTTSQYLNGGLLQRHERLSAVETFDSQGAAIGRYNLVYTLSPNTSRSQLTKLDYCAGGKCSSAIEFSWTGKNKVALGGATNTGFRSPRYFDTNGDGVAEIYGEVSNDSRGNATVKDLKGAQRSGVKSFSLTGSVISPNLSYNQCSVNTASSYRAANGQLASYCQFSSCSGEQCKYGSKGVNYGDFDGNGVETYQKGYATVDINGDGIDDLYNFDVPKGGYRYRITGMDWQTLPSTGERVLKAFSDINNDGYLDAVMGFSSKSENLSVYLFNGVSFNSPISINLKPSVDESIYFADINNDGFPDLGFGKHFYLNNKNNDFSTSPILTFAANIFSAQDVNGDGWIDILTRGKGVNDSAFIYYSAASLQDKITIVSELGVDYLFNYKPAVDKSVYNILGSNVYPFKNTTPLRYLLSGVVKKPRGYEPIRYEYYYEGMKSHIDGIGTLGFRSITEKEFAEVVTITKTTYDQARIELSGQPILREVFKNGRKISESAFENKLHIRRGFNAQYYQVYANQITDKSYDSEGLIERQESSLRIIDRFGNLVEESKSISSELEGAGRFLISSQFDYSSTGLNNQYNVYHIHNENDEDDGFDDILTSFKSGLSRYCADNGEVYFKPNDYIALIHAEVDIPLMLERYSRYFKYQTTSSSTDLDGLTTFRGELIETSASSFNSANVSKCGTYSVNDFDSDGSLEISTSNSTRTELVSETGNSFWKLGAVKKSKVTTTDLESNMSRTTMNIYDYNTSGFLIANSVQNSDYESNSEAGLTGKKVYHLYEHDIWGNTISDTIEGSDLPPRTSLKRYDDIGLFPTSSLNPLLHSSSTEFDSKGLLISVTSPLKKRKTYYKYDSFGRQVSEALPGVGNVNKTQYALGKACGEHALEQTVSCTTNIFSTGGKEIRYFDYAGREIRKLHTSFSGQLVAVDTQWDRNGRKTSVTLPRFITTKEPASKTVFTYDDLNREVHRVEPTNNNSPAIYSTVYEGYRTSVKDARGYTHGTVTNVMGYTLRKEEPDDSYQTYSYYPDGKLRSSSDSAGNTLHIRYDSLGYRSFLDDPDMGKWHYVYNAAGELIYKRDAKEIVTTFEYDKLGRKTKQVEDGKVSTWRYDEHGALGTLSGFTGNGSETDYYYNASGLSEEVSVKVKGEVFSTFYYYDDFERVTREVRPNGAVTTLADAAKQLSSANNKDRLAVEYVYNTYGYQSAVRSPKTYADEVFTSSKFRDDIAKLLDAAKQQAAQYLAKAERYSQQTSFFSDKAAQYSAKTVNIHTLDPSSLELLKEGYRYKQWCNEQGECYLRPGTWVMLHDDVTIPIDVTLEGAIYRLNTALANRSTGNGTRYYNATVHPVPESEFDGQNLSSAHDYLLTDYDGNGVKDLMSNQDIYIAEADASTREELLFSADDLEKAAVVASTRYKFYTDLARELIELSEQVATLSGQYCQYANQLGGNQIDSAKRSSCQNSQQSSQADHLNLILTQSQLADSTQNQAYVYYWQRRETDAYDHTLAETLGNGLVNTYSHDANTGRPNYITTHKASVLFDPSIRQSTAKGRNVRFIQYRYDNHNNVTYRYDESLGITDTWQYDGLDRVVHNKVSLVSKDRHGVNNPDFAGQFEYQYDKLGNIKYKSDIGRYDYSGRNAGPHAVTKANGLHYQYDANGNMLRARADGSAQNERELEWTAFNKPSKIVRNGKTVEFFYDANHNRYLKKNSDGIETFYFGKSYERITDTNTGITQHKHFVYAGGKLIALNTQSMDDNNQLKDKQIRYLHYDALNSVDMITDGYGNVVERRSYDTWGKLRGIIWRQDDLMAVTQPVITSRAYTGHENIEEVELVHMNGRVYDPELARFISADPYVQQLYSVGSFNRYSYVLNNPLSYTDPSGYFFKPLKKIVRKVIKKIDYGVAKALVSIGSAFCGPWAPACAAVASYQVDRAHGMSSKDSLKSAAVAGGSQWVFTSGNITTQQAAIRTGSVVLASKNPKLGQAVMFLQGNWGESTQSMIQNAVGSSLQYLAQGEIQRQAARMGLSLEEFNLILGLNSKIGLHIAGGAYNGSSHVTGFTSRHDKPIFGVIWDINDTLLNVQGLTDAVSSSVINSLPSSRHLKGHSLGAWRVNNLLRLGYIKSATLFSLPGFSYPAAGSQGYCATFDFICGGGAMSVMRPSTTSVSSPVGGFSLLTSPFSAVTDNHMLTTVPAYSNGWNH